MTGSAILPVKLYGTLIILLAGITASLSSAQQTDDPPVPAPHKFVAPKLPQPKQWHSPAVKRSMVGGLWMMDPNYRSVLNLRNDVETSSLTVTPCCLGRLGLASWAPLFGQKRSDHSAFGA